MRKIKRIKGKKGQVRYVKVGFFQRRYFDDTAEVIGTDCVGSASTNLYWTHTIRLKSGEIVKGVHEVSEVPSGSTSVSNFWPVGTKGV